ncbi:DUF2249 domain-containing protein [Natronoarchaeum sp. GCM10025703]|uniref:DUF2249 domain-containing protein n=1 Tax=unclassified Natronoarchaeum TaxID=2620183 RepID=UPI0036176DBF
MSTSEPVLDAREINEPPFEAISEALDDLDEGATLTLINPFEPRPLYDVLDERGFTHTAEQVAESEWHVEIKHR